MTTAGLSIISRMESMFQDELYFLSFVLLTYVPIHWSSIDLRATLALLGSDI
jgi:hypothetical protein